jgi:hypothetical protein
VFKSRSQHSHGDTKGRLSAVDRRLTVNTTQMNVTEHAGIDDFMGVSRGFSPNRNGGNQGFLRKPDAELHR